MRVTKNYLQIYPNPVNPYSNEINIHYLLAAKSDNVDLSIFNIPGRKIGNIFIDENLSQGFLTWNLTENYSDRLPSGIYFIVLNSADIRISKKLLILY